MNKASPYYAAFLRALLVGLFSGLSAFLATWSTTNDAKTIAIAAATAFPIAVWEFSLGVYLTFWGFKASPITATSESI